MVKERKLVIIHYYGEDVQNIGKSSSGFPLQVQVRYKKLKSVFSSRLGLRYANLMLLGEQKIRDSFEFAQQIIKDEVAYIQNFRIYFENHLGIEFNPSYLCNVDFDNYFLSNVTDYFSQLIINELNSYEFKDKEISLFFEEFQKIEASTDLFNPKGKEIFSLFERSKIISIFQVIEIINPVFFNKLFNLGNIRFIYSIFKILVHELNLDKKEISLLEFRLLDFSINLKLKEFKSRFDFSVDEMVRKISSKAKTTNN